MKKLSKMHSIDLVICPTKINSFKHYISSLSDSIFHYNIEYHRYYKTKPFYTASVYASSKSILDIMYLAYDKRAS